MAKTATGTQPPAQQTMQQMAEAAMAQSRQMTQANPAAQALKERKERLKTMVKADSVVEQFRNALGRHSDTFVASIIDLYNSDSDLQQCNPTQVVQEALKAATLRLPINKQLGFAYIIAYNNSKPDGEGGWLKVKEPSFQIGYKGYIQLAMRSGQYEILNPIDFGGERTSDKIIGYFCHERLVNGFRKTLYMSVEEVAAHAKRYSKALKNNANVTVASLIKLAEQPFNPNSDKVGWLGSYWGMSDSQIANQFLYVAGYRDGVLKYDYGFADAKSSQHIKYRMDTQPGNSGGPVFTRDYYAIGINIAENDSYNTGYRLTTTVKGDLDGL